MTFHKNIAPKEDIPHKLTFHENMLHTGRVRFGIASVAALSLLVTLSGAPASSAATSTTSSANGHHKVKAPKKHKVKAPKKKHKVNVPTPPLPPILPGPSPILNLSDWYLTLPIGSGAASMIMQPQLSSYSSQYFFTNGAKDGVVFHAPVQGTTTSGSTHTRSELRETAPNGSLPWGWSAGGGTHIMAASEAITHLPGGNGTLGFAQIHGPGSTWYLILDAVGTGNGTAKLVVKDNTGNATGAIIDAGYKIGTRFGLTVSAINGVVGIDYNGVRKVTTHSTQANSYFKIGAYNQSAGDFGEAVLYGVSVTNR
jgi:Alginate lyase